uniref:Aquaporin-4 n=1 Tax=Geotrypetes seraphini TaxID=260995 RepID=A0A6P8SJ85_GEOSA|nr:aquaporin-8-like isoform X2 [Geotrypetes seraphini]
MASDGMPNTGAEMQNLKTTSKEELISQNNEMDERSILEKYIQPCLCELLGTMLFITVVCISVLNNVEGASPLVPALASGLALGALIIILGKISGAHFNPAVTLAVYASGGISPLFLAPYFFCQLSGGMLGTFLAKIMVNKALFVNGTGASCMVGERSTISEALFVELIFSFFLIFIVVMGVLGDQSKTDMTSFSVSFTVIAAALGGGSISGACLNPARAFGPAVVANYWSYHWIFWIAPFISAILVSIIYRTARRKERMISFTFLVFLQFLPCWKKKNLPPGPFAWPLIGNIHQMVSSAPHKTLMEGTEVIAFLHSSLNDKKYWKDSEYFNPNRFLDENGKFKKNEAYIPFGAGKRSCVGESLARTEIFIFFISLLQKFTLKVLTGESNSLDSGTCASKPFNMCFVESA